MQDQVTYFTLYTLLYRMGKSCLTEVYLLVSTSVKQLPVNHVLYSIYIMLLVILYFTIYLE